MSVLCNTAHKLIEAVFSKTVNIYKDSRNVKVSFFFMKQQADKQAISYFKQ